MREPSRNFFKRMLILGGVIPIFFIVFSVQEVSFFFGYALILIPVASILHGFQACNEVCLDETMLIISVVVCLAYALYVFNRFSWRVSTYANIVKNTFELLLLLVLILVPAAYYQYTKLSAEYSEAMFSPPQLITFEEARDAAIQWNQDAIANNERLLEVDRAYDAGTLNEEDLQKAYNEILGGGKFKVAPQKDTLARIENTEAYLQTLKAFTPPNAEQEYERALAEFNKDRISYESRGAPTILDAIQRALGFRGW